MSEARPDRTAALRTLRQFQRDTVDHVVTHLLDENGSKRFLVADEVGLGKTLVARGVIAEFVERHWDDVGRIDVIYVCSNAALARENLSKLRIGGEKVGVIEATRFTLMATAEERLRHKLNFISLTPATALRTVGGGIKEERIVLHRLLRQRGAEGRWLDNFLQGGIANTERWRELTRASEPLKPEIVERFHRALEKEPALVQRLSVMTTAFARIDGTAARDAAPEARRLTGDLRNLLARVCIDSVQPDLIILDEFQRFKDLLSTNQVDVSPEAELARQLFAYRTPEDRRVALLLLSATPYRMFTTQSESVRGVDSDDHYADFLQTLEFLVADAGRFAALKGAIQQYRDELVRAAAGVEHAIGPARERLQALLLRVMCRRERVGSTEQRDGMVKETRQVAELATGDVKAYLALERLREHLDGNDLVELWKSAPYLLNFGRAYEFRSSFDAKADDAALAAELAAQVGAHLDAENIAEYGRIDPGNGRLRLLAEHTVDNDRWRMLWLPPSLPYWPLEGAWARNADFTKKLLFSCWNVVPDAVSALLSYEVERRGAGGSQAADAVKYAEFYRKRARLLRFAMSDGRAGSMMTFALRIPCLRLANIHPLALCCGDDRDVRRLMRAHVEPLLEGLKPWAEGQTSDPSWYWAALLLLDEPDAVRTLLDELDPTPNVEGGESPEEPAEATDHLTGFAAHVERARSILTPEVKLGAFPVDLLDVLVELALGSPAILWARTLSNFGVHDGQRRRLGAQMGEAFRSLFNQPPVTRLLQREDAARYWQATLQYSIEGNLQAVLDEYAHLLWEPTSWEESDVNGVAGKVTEAAAAAITTKTSTVRPDYYRGDSRRIERVAQGSALRTHFALRYGTVRSGDGAHEVREDAVRDAFKSPFYPFVLASTSVGQEGLDFHPWCHSVWHWNLPGNPVDLEQREGRVHRYKGHAVRKNVAERHRGALLAEWSPGRDPWQVIFDIADRARAPGESELVPCWLAPGPHKVERFIPMLPLSREEAQLDRLKRSLAIYRVVFGQPRQAELVALIDRAGISSSEVDSWVVKLEPGREAQTRSTQLDPSIPDVKVLEDCDGASGLAP